MILFEFYVFGSGFEIPVKLWVALRAELSLELIEELDFGSGFELWVEVSPDPNSWSTVIGCLTRVLDFNEFEFSFRVDDPFLRREAALLLFADRLTLFPLLFLVLFRDLFRDLLLAIDLR